MLQYRYFVAAIEGSFAWPDKRVGLTFDGDKFQLVPPTPETHATVVLDIPALPQRRWDGFGRFDADLEKVNRLLSALAWADGHALSVIDAHGGPNALPVTRGTFRSLMPMPAGLWLYESADVRHQRALALYREGLVTQSDHPAIAFLAYFRVVEAAYGSFRESGLAPKLDALSQRWSSASYNVMKLIPAGEVMSKFLLDTCRNAVAHAAWDSTHSPDDAAEARVIRERIPLVKLVAETAMREELHIPSMLDMIDANHADPLAPAPGWKPLERID